MVTRRQKPEQENTMASSASPRRIVDYWCSVARLAAPLPRALADEGARLALIDRDVEVLRARRCSRRRGLAPVAGGGRDLDG